jgi:hypothetical protein
LNIRLLLYAYPASLVATRLTIRWTLAISPWEDALTIRWMLALSLSRGFHRHPLLARCVSVRRLPANRLLISRLTRVPADSGLDSVVSPLDLSRLLQTTLSVSFSRKHEKALVFLPFTSNPLAQRQVWRQMLPMLHTTRRCCFSKRLEFSVSRSYWKLKPWFQKLRGSSRFKGLVALCYTGRCCFSLHYYERSNSKDTMGRFEENCCNHVYDRIGRKMRPNMRIDPNSVWPDFRKHKIYLGA